MNLLNIILFHILVLISLNLLINNLTKIDYYVPNINESIILVTGASSGSGLGSAIELSKAGFTVFAGIRKEKDKLKDEFINNQNIIPIILDVTNNEDINNVYNEINAYIKKTNKKFHGLFNNAGLCLESVFESADLDNDWVMMEINLLGMMKVTQKFIPLIRKYKGRIINHASLEAAAPMKTHSMYSASKSAIVSFSKSLLYELSKFNIYVGYLGSAGFKSRSSNNISKKFKESYTTNLPNDEYRELYKNLYDDELLNMIDSIMDSATTIDEFGKLIVNLFINKNPPIDNYPGSVGFLNVKFLYTIQQIMPEYLGLMINKFQ